MRSQATRFMVLLRGNRIVAGIDKEFDLPQVEA